MPGETPEQRAFRRFPINVHKPGDLRDTRTERLRAECHDYDLKGNPLE
jgi:hypothetical protein